VHVSFDKVVEAIRRSGADVVAIEEAQGHTLALQRALGWPYASPRLQILSKYPLIDPPGADGLYLFVQLAPGQVVAIENVHLPSNPYGPFEVKQGETKRSVLELGAGSGSRPSRRRSRPRRALGARASRCS
jgi:hypothetical protein